MDIKDELLQEILAIPNNTIVLQLPTGVGKTRLAIEKIKSWNINRLLIVINRLALIDTWKTEIKKWRLNCKDITFVTYQSLHKQINESYDAIIYDEGHHISNRCAHIIPAINSKYNLVLSATIPREVLDRFSIIFKGAYYLKKNLRHVIDEGVLPDPKVYLLPLKLDNKDCTETLIINPKGKIKKKCTYDEHFQYLKDRKYKLLVQVTKQEKYNYLDGQIEYWKNRYFSTSRNSDKNRWLSLCSTRLKYLSTIKLSHIKDILTYIKNTRSITFCNTIEQTKALGTNCINSNNKDSLELLDSFNSGSINHIYTCNMLNEGVNLVNCRIGVFCNLNSSDTIIIQRVGRLLRHKDPIIIIPYYLNTREQELVTKMCENYNPQKIKSITCLNQLVL